MKTLSLLVAGLALSSFSAFAKPKYDQKYITEALKSQGHDVRAEQVIVANTEGSETFFDLVNQDVCEKIGAEFFSKDNAGKTLCLCYVTEEGVPTGFAP